jgi:hypothetical protein
VPAAAGGSAGAVMVVESTVPKVRCCCAPSWLEHSTSTHSHHPPQVISSGATSPRSGTQSKLGQVVVTSSNAVPTNAATARTKASAVGANASSGNIGKVGGCWVAHPPHALCFFHVHMMWVHR